MNIYSYPTVYALGHKAIENIFENEVQLEEKIDGSQASFMVDGYGELSFRSKNKQFIFDAPEKMFLNAVNSVLERKDLLHPHWIYRCEYLSIPHHNTLQYERVPKGYLIGFDISTGLESYMEYWEKVKEFSRIGLECVPIIYKGKVDSLEQFKEYLEMDSILGGTKIEGVVVKNYNLFTTDKKIAIGKYVSEQFKEQNKVEWSKTNPPPADLVVSLITQYKTEARWMKAVQHLRDNGELEESPRDIGNIMKEVKADTLKECEDEIKDILFRHYWPKVERGITAGIPEWWKDYLLKKAFEV